MDTNDPAYKGQRDYGPAFLAVYDWWVLRFMTRAVLRSPTPLMVDRYKSLIGRRHLDIGPGSGFFIDATAPKDVELTLLDPNTHVLDHCVKRLSRFSPTAVEGDVLKPLPIQGPYDSVAMNAVLHCLPGPMGTKIAAVKNAAAVLDSEGVLFGGTVLGINEHHSLPARAFLRAANKQGGFDNLLDSRDGLEDILSASFSQVEIEVVGSMALFTARNPGR